MVAPQDVYKGVANLVHERMEKDAAKGNVNAQLMLGEVCIISFLWLLRTC